MDIITGITTSVCADPTIEVGALDEEWDSVDDFPLITHL
jgi:hypothetical protein